MSTLSLVPPDDAKAEDIAEFWARTAVRLLTENAAMRARLGDLKLAAHSVRGAQSELERQLACSVLAQMAMGGVE